MGMQDHLGKVKHLRLGRVGKFTFHLLYLMQNVRLVEAATDQMQNGDRTIGVGTCV